MKRIISVLLLLALCLTLAACKSDDPTPEGMQNVADEEAAFNLYVPSSWVPRTESGVSGAAYGGNDQSNVICTGVLPDEGIDSIEKYWNNVCLGEYHATLPAFAVREEECGATTLGGLNAQKYVFTYTIGEESFVAMQVITSYSGMIYTLQYTALSANYNAHLEEVNGIVAAFTFR